jgi:hypothetical protein
LWTPAKSRPRAVYPAPLEQRTFILREPHEFGGPEHVRIVQTSIEERHGGFVIQRSEKSLTKISVSAAELTRLVGPGWGRHVAYRDTRPVARRTRPMLLLVSLSALASLSLGALTHRWLQPAQAPIAGTGEIRIILPPPPPSRRNKDQPSKSDTPAREVTNRVPVAMVPPPPSELNTPTQTEPLTQHEPADTRADAELAPSSVTEASRRAVATGEVQSWEQNGKTGFVLAGQAVVRNGETCRELTVWERGGVQGEAITRTDCEAATPRP